MELPPAQLANLLEIAVEHKDIISLGPGEPDFPLPKPLVSYTKKIAGNVNHYSPVGGRHELKEAITRKLAKDNKIKAGADNIVVTSGSMEGLMLAFMSAADATEQIIVPNPGYMSYVPCAELADVVPVPLQLEEENRFEPNPDDIRLFINEKTAGLVINTPANPTGNVIRRKTLEEIADMAVEYDLYIFSDEAYEHIIYDDARHVSIGSFNGLQDYVISLFTFSKSYAMCGFRIGYCAGPEELIAAMTKAHTYTTIAAPTISQFLAIKALSLPHKYINKMLKEYSRRRNLIVKRLNELGLITHIPQGAFYTFSNIQNFSKDSRKFSKMLLNRAKIAVVPGVEFGAYGEGYIRCSYATKYELIEKAMNRIEGALKKHL